MATMEKKRKDADGNDGETIYELIVARGPGNRLSAQSGIGYERAIEPANIQLIVETIRPDLHCRWYCAYRHGSTTNFKCGCNGDFAIRLQITGDGSTAELKWNRKPHAEPVANMPAGREKPNPIACYKGMPKFGEKDKFRLSPEANYFLEDFAKRNCNTEIAKTNKKKYMALTAIVIRETFGYDITHNVDTTSGYNLYPAVYKKVVQYDRVGYGRPPPKSAESSSRTAQDKEGGRGNGEPIVIDLVDDSDEEIEIVEKIEDISESDKMKIQFTMTGSGEDIVARVGPASTVSRRSLCTLKDGVWLNDEVIDGYIGLVSSERKIARTTQHFMPSFFMTKLLPDEGSRINYQQVRTWTKNVNLFTCEQVYVPINENNVHWTGLIADMKERRIQYYDSLGGTGRDYMEAMLEYLGKEHMRLYGCSMDKTGWCLIPSKRSLPRQSNTYDCGVFLCLFFDYLSSKRPFNFSAIDMPLARRRIAKSILDGKIVV